MHKDTILSCTDNDVPKHKNRENEREIGRGIKMEGEVQNGSGGGRAEGASERASDCKEWR